MIHLGQYFDIDKQLQAIGVLAFANCHYTTTIHINLWNKWNKWNYLPIGKCPIPLIHYIGFNIIYLECSNTARKCTIKHNNLFSPCSTEKVNMKMRSGLPPCYLCFHCYFISLGSLGQIYVQCSIVKYRSCHWRKTLQQSLILS